MNVFFLYFFRSFSNRDIAIIFWLLVLVVFFLVNSGTRNSFCRVIRCLLVIKLLIPIILGILIILSLTYVLWKNRLWNFSILKDTIIYGITATFTLFRYISDPNRLFFKDVLSNIKATIIVAFYLNQVSLCLVGELVLVPLIVFLVFLSTYSDINKDKVDTRVRGCLKGVIMFIILSLFIYNVWTLVCCWEDYFTRDSILALLFPIIVNPVYIIYAYMVGVYSLYETLFLRFKFLYASQFELGSKLLLFRECGINKKKIQFFSSNWCYAYNDGYDNDFMKSFRQTLDEYRITK